MKYLDSRKFSRHDSSKNVYALWTGFDISWVSLRCGGGAGARRRGGGTAREAVRSFMASQEVGTARLSEAVAERDALAAELALWLSEKGSNGRAHTMNVVHSVEQL